MGRYDRSYDFGMRGYRQTTRPLDAERSRHRAYDRPFDLSYPGGGQEYPPPPNRVTARYNRDYVEGYRHPDDRRSFGFYGGDRPDRMGDESMYRRPYTTIGGTRTLRGARDPRGFLPGRYGPPGRGRYFDDF